MARTHPPVVASYAHLVKYGEGVAQVILQLPGHLHRVVATRRGVVRMRENGRFPSGGAAVVKSNDAVPGMPAAEVGGWGEGGAWTRVFTLAPSRKMQCSATSLPEDEGGEAEVADGAPKEEGVGMRAQTAARRVKPHHHGARGQPQVGAYDDARA